MMRAALALARWEHIDLQAAVQALTPLPVEFAKDTTSACVAELIQGHGRTLRSFLYIYVGTFVGGGLVLAGHIMGGERGNAGAIGSLPLGMAQPGSPAQLLEKSSGWQLEQALIQAGQQAVDDAIAYADRRLFRLDAPPLWGVQDRTVLRQDVADSLRREVQQENSFVAQYAAADVGNQRLLHVLQLLLLLLRQLLPPPPYHHWCAAPDTLPARAACLMPRGD